MTVKAGDRVKVAFEGEVTWAGESDPTHADVRINGLNAIVPISVMEVISPPVPAFQAGDVLTVWGETRVKHEDGSWYNSRGDRSHSGSNADQWYESHIGDPDTPVVVVIRGGELVR